MIDSLPLPLFLLFGLITLLALLAWWRSLNRIRWGNARRMRVAQHAEAQAEHVLRRHGYTILDRQLTRRWSMHIDGRRLPVHSRADLLVTKRGHRYVAEVKTGTTAPDPTRPATRRQLLEYLHAFPVQGVLLVDMVTKRIHQVEFGFDPPSA